MFTSNGVIVYLSENLYVRILQVTYDLFLFKRERERLRERERECRHLSRGREKQTLC